VAAVEPAVPLTPPVALDPPVDTPPVAPEPPDAPEPPVAAAFGSPGSMVAVHATATAATASRLAHSRRFGTSRSRRFDPSRTTSQ
jgi:hypothetical protein